MAIPKIEDCECEDFRSYCRWEGSPFTQTPNGYSSCEGSGCVDAYKDWVEENAVTCTICKDEFISNHCLTIEDVNGKEHFVCEECHEDKNNEIKIINIKFMGETV